jgi:hypothetical protein
MMHFLDFLIMQLFDLLIMHFFDLLIMLIICNMPHVYFGRQFLCMICEF